MEQQQIPAGYKQTEVGLIPEDWSVKRLGELSSFKTGPFGSALHKSDYTYDGVPIINPMHIMDGHIVPSLAMSITEDTAKRLSDFRLSNNEIIIGRRGDMGRCAVVRKNNIGWLCGTGSMIVRTSKLVNPDFIQLILASQEVIAAITETSVGSTMINLNQSTLSNLKIKCPPIEEQTAIANALSDTDTLIQSLEKLIAKKRAIKTATMQRLLTGKKRLPDFDSHSNGELKGYKQTEFGEVPKDWEVVTVGEVSDLLTGFPFPSNHYSDNGVRLLRGSNIKRGVTDWSDEITQYWPAITMDIKKYELCEKDIVISMDGSLVGRSFAQFTKADLPAILLQRVARLRSEKIDIDFLKEWVCSKFFTEHCDSVKTTTAIPHISPADIRSFPIYTPVNKEEQTAIAAVLADMDKDIEALEKRLGKTRQVKQGMMQELLTGRTQLV